MADFGGSLKKIIPTTGETKVLLGWGLATAVLFALQYVVFAFVTGSGVSTRRLPVLRVVSLGAVAYAVLMIRDLIAYYAGVAVDEMFSLSPVVVFGVLLFMTGFLIYGLHDIQNIGSAVASSSERSGGNLFSFFFEGDGEGFEDEDQDADETPRKRPAGAHRDQGIVQQPPSFLQPAGDMSVSQYGIGSDPFTVSRASGGGGGGGGLPAATRDKHVNQQNLDPRGGVGGGGGGSPSLPPAQAPLYAAAPMGGGLSGGSSFAAF